VKRAGLGLVLAACALAGAFAAVLLAGPSPASILTTVTSTGSTDTTTGAATTTGVITTTTTATTATTTAPPPTTTSARSVIAQGVRVGGVGVGGLAPAVAVDLVRTAFAAPLVLLFDGRTLQPSPVRLGTIAYVKRAVNRASQAAPGTALPLTVRVRGARVRSYVAALAQRFDREPVDARLVLRGLKPFITRGTPGRALDRVAATKAIIDALVRNRRFPIRLQAKAVTPAVTRESFGPVIVIRRGSNRLHLYDGMRLRRTFGVATGQARYPTPLGRFSIVVMWKNPWWYPPDSDWADGQEPVPPGPGNPLGTRWMGISAPGVGIHGTPDPGSIGYSVSHGCIRMQIPDAEWLFTQVAVGTTVFIVAA
jgi:lipoprotein-anchoring transpeptidase ErfK/SrfK